MPPPRSWLSPPTRRELTLLLFSLTIFVLSYNLETSLQLVGVPPAKLRSSYLTTIGLGTKDPGLEPDGRRPREWRDKLEDVIFGDWEWKEGQVAGVERGQVGISSVGAAIYNVGSRSASRSAGKEDKGVSLKSGVTPKEQFLRWEEGPPETKAVVHVPGYTILDNLVVANGTFFIVTDDPASVPPLPAIASSAADATQPPRERDWQIISHEEARTRLSKFAGRIFGTTWISTAHAEVQDPYTLFSLFRAHSALTGASSTSFTSSSGLRIITPPGSRPSLDNLPAPMRLIFPNVPTFSSPHIPPPSGDEKEHPPPRIRSYNGIHPLLPKAILPTLSMWYTEDWDDIKEINDPWLFERAVIADRGAAARGRDRWAERWSPQSGDSGKTDELRRRADAEEGIPVWAAPFVGLSAEQGWWRPVRSALLRYLRISEETGQASGRKGRKGASSKPLVTYVSMQEEPAEAGPRLLDQDHEALVAGLTSLMREGVLGEVHVVKGNGSVPGPEWDERMSAIARSSVVLGPYGLHLADSIFMSQPTPTSTEGQPVSSLLMEFFPPGIFIRDQEFAVRSLGMRYMAWWNDRKFTGNSLPPIIRPDETISPGLRMPLDVTAVLNALREEASRRHL
ncbi:hypothetical protein CERSUDRAFT_116315 [Gelatoporia subvermispora B]|uniref:Uncharacterized protein n=1 Tax=Ceriporiopsis subvermispora (strain B) TaxID=914234 RepID=M2RAZ0_CERS8|nr:hypothetical protein CERSUDRAFT_116315 [Gelatoporia subvermispora B]